MTDITLSPNLSRLFVTEIYKADLTGIAGFNDKIDELEDACRGVADDDVTGQDWCQKHSYLGYTSYGSVEDISRHATVFEELKRQLDIHVNSFATQVELDLSNRKLKLVSMWVNILDQYGAHSGHVHPHCAVSGTFYVSIPPGASAIRFEDPRLPQMMAAPLRLTSSRIDRQNFATFQPVRGTLLLWESWLRHEVLMNLSEEPRISISFNYA
ncbi:TIGR02466 family protein [Asticcacaulis sp. AC402]|uniref:TIGR02466 family protein n=1 Tax=Asticcacaulis sp. AC402 TaxID=1282361 RepID=UPI0003C3B02E|nr:TIGR02466 family protein [Asticcacaulis sp. AC402]ESQ76348.1 hypothetical protein ABAC402_04415 [Asticcacaulis sp. AC402]